ncbi:MAG TPA: cytochrome c biogenesis protein CcsA [Paenibacillus sp.]|uniref:cytochrome c biogenesis protein CcsA n=1 Tax=Paenibacillus sp. TaxID=58172 RepID=UPI002B9C992C|nr:cytochrome c biogenesis protein CcsA [Paenibacillus sp.]HUC92382.1 cytochrome c biogenesis protein CcsA [Paenibacillus sp.]
MTWLDVSSVAFMIAFFLYCFAFLFFVIAVAGRKWSNREPVLHMRKWSRIAFLVSTLGLAAQLVYFFTRWAGAGHIPTSNMYEFMTFLGMAIMIAFTIVYLIYRSPLLGMFTLPLAVIIIAYAAVFPQEVQPLVPALQSNWLKVHVTTAALGEAFFAVGFAAGLMYLLRVVDFEQTDKAARRAQRWVEFTLYVIVVLIAFIGTVFAFRGMDYTAVFTREDISIDQKGVQNQMTMRVEYKMPPIVKPYNSEVEQMDSFLGMREPLLEAPSWMKGVNAGRKLNTVVWSIVAGTLLYGVLRLLLRKPIAAVIHPALDGIDPEDLDEITYRSIAIGFPVFTLGAIIFAMIWAEQAWGRFWGWDPKEVWALITWLFYSAYLHFRLSRGWQGLRSAWLAVIGFIVVMFTLVGVNLVIAGLHSYAGV